MYSAIHGLIKKGLYMKRNIQNLILLFFLSILSFLSFYTEVLNYGWTGLLWVRLNYISFIFIPLLFFAWLNFIFNRKLNFIQNIKIATVYIVAFTLHILLFSIYYITGPNAMVIISNPIITLLKSYNIIILILLSVLLYAANKILFKILQIDIQSKIQNIFLYFSGFIIYVFNIFLLKIIDSLNVVPIEHIEISFNSIYSFKTGSIILAYLLFEGLIIIFNKNNSKLLTA